MKTITNSMKLRRPLELVLQVTHHDLLENLPGYTKMLGMEEIKRIRFDQHEDGSQDIEFSMKSKDRLPAFARKIIKPEMLAWRQAGKWNPENLTFEFKVLPYFFQNVVSIGGRKRYLQEDGVVTMEISARISIGIPGAGALLEQAIASEINKEQLKMFAKFEREISARANA